jgi:hypothetical protein
VVVADHVVLMHQGGWDEMLMVLGPLAIVIALIALARKHVPSEEEPDDPSGLQREAGADPAPGERGDE